MTEAIIVAIIALIGNIAVSWFAHRRSTALLEYRLQQLEDKVQVHNNLIDRMYHAETDIALLQNDMDEMKKAGD